MFAKGLPCGFNFMLTWLDPGPLFGGGFVCRRKCGCPNYTRCCRRSFSGKTITSISLRRTTWSTWTLRCTTTGIHARWILVRWSWASCSLGWAAVCWEGDRARVRELPSGSEFSLEGPGLAKFLAGVRVVFAAHVFRLFDEAGVLASTDTHRFDLMPMPSFDGQRQYDSRLCLEDFIQATLHTCYGAKSSLEERLVYHAALLSYGQLHGFVMAPDSPENPPVYWDIGLEGDLRARFLRALQESREIWVSHKPPETLRPELYRSPFQVERPGEEQVYGQLAGVRTTLFYRDIYLAHSPPCASSLEQHTYRLTQPWFLQGPVC